MVFQKAGRCGWEGKGRFHFPLPSSVTLSGHFIPTPVTRALPGRICAQVGWGASSACPRHPWIPCRLGAGAHCASASGECGRGSSHGAPSSGWDPLLGQAIRITLCKILIIVVSKAPPLAVAGPCPGSPNNQHLWHFSHPWWGAGSRDPWVLRRQEPLPGAQPGTGRCQEAGRGWGRVGVCVRGGCKVKKGRI